MSTFLFDDIVFGPVKSRRFGNSLGINLLPENKKICTFNCIYCECGWTNKEKPEFPDFKTIESRMKSKFKELRDNSVKPDNITFAGNGEPTMHPDFHNIIIKTQNLRDTFFPKAKIVVLTNGTLLHKESVIKALRIVDSPVLKLDSAIEKTVRQLNLPYKGFNFKRYIEGLRNFPGNPVIQTMFVKYKSNKMIIDNTTENELKYLTRELKIINPSLVMLYSIARDTADSGVEQVSKHKLEEIAKRLAVLGINTEIS